MPAEQSGLAPQCNGSTWGSTQDPPHAARFAAHVGAHTPFEQTLPLAQAVPLVQLVVAPQ
jgi:hypothetical protein